MTKRILGCRVLPRPQRLLPALAQPNLALLTVAVPPAIEHILPWLTDPRAIAPVSLLQPTLGLLLLSLRARA